MAFAISFKILYNAKAVGKSFFGRKSNYKAKIHIKSPLACLSQFYWILKKYFFWSFYTYELMRWFLTQRIWLESQGCKASDLLCQTTLPLSASKVRKIMLVVSESPKYLAKVSTILTFLSRLKKTIGVV